MRRGEPVSLSAHESGHSQQVGHCTVGFFFFRIMKRFSDTMIVHYTVSIGHQTFLGFQGLISGNERSNFLSCLDSTAISVSVLDHLNRASHESSRDDTLSVI
jgi:hypothetical protein